MTYNHYCSFILLLTIDLFQQSSKLASLMMEHIVG